METTFRAIAFISEQLIHANARLETRDFPQWTEFWAMRRELEELTGKGLRQIAKLSRDHQSITSADIANAESVGKTIMDWLR